MNRFFAWGLASLVVLSGQGTAQACGPFFPNNLLDQGDNAVLTAPVASFKHELLRMRLVNSRFHAVQPTNTPDLGDYLAQTASAELADLRGAMQKGNLPAREQEQVLAQYEATRLKLNAFRAALQLWKRSQSGSFRQFRSSDEASEPDEREPIFPALTIPVSLPGEFFDYMEGAIAWNNPGLLDKGFAQQAWERLLRRPASERCFRSTWAAFMLGRSWEKQDPQKARAFFQQVRALASQGYPDSEGLAAASLGMEARICLLQTNYVEAMELYLQQMATGDDTAADSLHLTAMQAFKSDPKTLESLARNPRTQQTMTAFLISRDAKAWRDGTWDDQSTNSSTEETDAALAWLRAVEAVNVHDVDSVEKLALAAYQINDMQHAERWLQRAPGTPLSRWLQAKLLLRKGNTSQAAAMLAQIKDSFPIQPPDTNAPEPATLSENLFLPEPGCEPCIVPASRQVLGELGVLRLARCEYTESLDALLNAGFWMDAAYVAERVLTVEELKSYVDVVWPLVSAEQVASETASYGESEVSPAPLRKQIRHLLARRLTRCMRTDEARDYYPPEWLNSFDALTESLRAGRNEALPAAERARGLFRAAFVTRTNGMDLIGTEVGPDWRFYGGDFDYGVCAADRATNVTARLIRATPDELERASHHTPDPDARFHYRYQAAFLAWEAAELLPNNDDETARILWTAGCWLKARDPQTADIFYKALVRRNRKTALGQEADRERWFPELDKDGVPVPKRKQKEEAVSESETASSNSGMPGTEEDASEDQTEPAEPDAQ